MTTRRYPWLPESVERSGELHIDWTAFQNIEACKRKAAIIASLRRELAVDSWDLVAGRAIHEALDVRQKALMRGERRSDVLLRLMEASLEGFLRDLTVPPDEYRTLGRLKEVVGVYQQTFEAEPFEIVESEQAREKELGVALWWDGLYVNMDGSVGCWRSCVVKWQGKLDGLWRNPDTSELSVKDTKTSSRDEFADSEGGEFSKGEAKYQMSGQLMGYAWLCSTPERPVTGAVLDQVVIRKPVQRVTAKTPPQNEAKRRFFHWTSGQIEEWRRDTLANIGEWLTACAKADNAPPPMTKTNCAWPRVCPYFSSCVQPTESERMVKLAGPRYRDRTWNPMTAGREAGK
jgi:hypothetical protein